MTNEIEKHTNSVSISGDISPNPRFWAPLWRWEIRAGDTSPVAILSPRNWRNWRILEILWKDWRIWQKTDKIGQNPKEKTIFQNSRVILT